jgi:hypothetical protein
MNNICSAPACPIILDSTCVFYTGANLIYTGVNTNDNLQIVLQKIDAKFRDAGLGYVFTNGLIQTAPGQPVKLGGSLVENTIITSQGFTFGLSGTIGSSAFITTGGTSSQFVKGDGSLDSGPYQPSGNYITDLTGDGTASGPGSSILTLATVFNAPATYGSSTLVPIITVNAKGLVTNVTTTLISVPSSSISINGDVYGYGNTGVPFNLTLQNVLVTPGTYGSVSAIPVINVNAKGLITSISQVAIGGGGIGTVTSVGVTSGTGISASVATPTTTPNITITNTAPDQTVVLNNGTGISVTGTYPNFTIAATGTSGVSSVTATSPLFSSGGATPNITIQQASGSQDGYLSLGDWTTFNGKVGGSGTTNNLSKWSSASSLTNSQITDDGSIVNISNYLLFENNATNYTGYYRLLNQVPLVIGGITNYSDTIRPYITLGIVGSNNMANGTTFIQNNIGDVVHVSGTYINTKVAGRILSLSGSPEHRFLDINPVYDDNGNPNTYTGTIRGVYYKLNENTILPVGAKNIAWENFNGDIIHGNLATGGADEMVTVDTSGKLKKQAIPTGSSVGFEMNFLLMGA